MGTDTGALARAFERLDEHHADIATMKSDLGGVKKDVGSLVGIVGTLTNEIKQLSTAVTGQVASRGPGWMEILQGCAVVIGILSVLSGAVGTGLAMYFSATYGTTIAQLESDAKAAKTDLATRAAEERAELLKLRQDDRQRLENRLSLAERLNALEDRSKWSTSTTQATP